MPLSHDAAPRMRTLACTLLALPFRLAPPALPDATPWVRLAASAVGATIALELGRATGGLRDLGPNVVRTAWRGLFACGLRRRGSQEPPNAVMLGRRNRRLLQPVIANPPARHYLADDSGYFPGPCRGPRAGDRARNVAGVTWFSTFEPPHEVVRYLRVEAVNHGVPALP